VLDNWGIPAVPVLEVAQNVVLARIAQAENKADDEVELWKKAAEAQDSIPYMEPPYWYYPVRQSLGAALLKSGHPEEAEKEFLAALDKARGSAWALFGLQRAAKAKGDAATEGKAAAELAKAWRGDPAMLMLEKL
jgi:tetratricopeptide (TPR) repeat protein